MSIKTKIREKYRSFLGIGAIEKHLNKLVMGDLLRQLDLLAQISSAEFIEAHMLKANALNSWEDVINFALRETQNYSDGLICEYGVYQGRTINHIARQTSLTVYGFDSFIGLPEDWRYGFEEGTFNLSNQNLPSFETNVKLIRGWFNETLPEFFQNHSNPMIFVHIDCDLYSSTKTIFDNIGKHLVIGSIIVFDEYFNYPGWKEHEHKAFYEFIEATGRQFEYICYNRYHQQVAVRILS